MRAGAISILQAGRLHFQETEMLTRRTIESVGFAAIIWKNPVMTDVLLEAYDSEQTFKRFRTGFGGKRLARALGALHPELPDQYSQRSKATHPTLQSAVLSQTQSSSANGFEITLHYFDAQEENWRRRLPLCLGAMLYCHVLALRGMATLALADADSCAEWERRAEPIFQRFEAVASTWTAGQQGHE